MSNPKQASPRQVRQKGIKALIRRVCWRVTEILYQHDPRHVDVLVESLRFETGNTLQTPIVDDVKTRIQ